MLAAYVEEQTQQSQWPFDQAAKVTGLPAELLRKLVRDEVLTGKAYWRTGSEVVGWCDINQAREIAAQLEAARAPVEGNGILPSEAARKYKFGTASVYKWHKAGWVKVVGTTSNGDRLYNEGDIAFAHAIAKLTGHKPGKKVFPSKLK